MLPKEFVGNELSHATLINKDLITTFLTFLGGCQKMGYLNPEQEKKYLKLSDDFEKLEYPEQEGYSNNYVAGGQEDDENWLLEDLFDLMNDIAPEGTIFGSHEGDGSSFGFWTCEDEDDFENEEEGEDETED